MSNKSERKSGHGIHLQVLGLHPPRYLASRNLCFFKTFGYLLCLGCSHVRCRDEARIAPKRRVERFDTGLALRISLLVDKATMNDCADVGRRAVARLACRNTVVD